MRTIYCLLLLLCPYRSMAQSPVLSSISPGSKVPDIVFTNLLNSKSATLSLSELKGKIIILDFWATWCSGCIKKIPLMDSMQRSNKNNLAIVLVNTIAAHDSKEKIIKLFGRLQQQQGRPIQLPVVLNDTVAQAFFPHKSLPHYVWINREGKCIAITGMDEINAANINLVLQKNDAAFALKDDYHGFDKKQLLFTAGNGGNGENILYRSTWHPYIAGLTSSSYIGRDSNKKITRLLYCNTPLLHLFKFAWQTDIPANRTMYPAACADVFNLAAATDASVLANSYTYELITPPLSVKNIYKQMQADLARFSGFNAAVKEVPTACYILTADTVRVAAYRSKGATATNKLYEPDEQFMLNKNAATLAHFLDGRLDRPVVDETGIAYNLDLYFTATNFYSLAQTQQALKQMGFSLTPAERVLPNFIITQNNIYNE